MPVPDRIYPAPGTHQLRCWELTLDERERLAEPRCLPPLSELIDRLAKEDAQAAAAAAPT